MLMTLGRCRYTTGRCLVAIHIHEEMKSLHDGMYVRIRRFTTG